MTLALLLDNLYKKIDTFIKKLGVEIGGKSESGGLSESEKKESVWEWLEQNNTGFILSNIGITDKFRSTQNANFAKKQTRQYFWNSANTKRIFGIEQICNVKVLITIFAFKRKLS